MTVCRNSVLAGFLLAFSAGTAAFGQDRPTAPPDASGTPQPLNQDDQAPPPAEFKPGILGSGIQTGVTTNELGIVDGAPVGTLDDTNGGLGQTIWANSQRAEIEDLLGKIPLVSADPFVRSLARRVVLTVSEAPVGPAKRALVTIRIEKLLQAGMINEAGAIAGALQLNGDTDYARVQADALLYAGSDAEICSDLTATRLTSAELYWLQLREWCFAAAGDLASAELTHSVIDAQGATDKALDALMASVLSGKSTPPGAIAGPTALHIYLLRKAGLPVTGTIASKLGTAANVIAARDTRNAPADRLAAATRIAQTGALAPAEILDILNAQDISADQLAHLADVAPSLAFLPTQSLYHRAAMLETRPAAKAELVAAALSADGQPGRLTLTAWFQSDLAASIKPDASLDDKRSLIARALLLSGRPSAAAAWYAKSSDNVDFSMFAVLVDIASPNPGRDAAAQAALGALAANVTPETPASPLVALALGLSDVLGKSMPPDAKTLATALEGTRFEGAHRPSAENLGKLEQAASQPGHKGEVALRILEIVGANGPFDLPADVAIECVRILQQAGLPDEARQLAVEALATAQR